MTDECVSSSWLELESDPGLFTLLIDDFGVKGVQVEEIYDLSKPLENSIFGFIFLFKWIERRSRRSKGALLEPHSNYVTDPNTVNKMFFAHQIVPNSCATHALLSILLNCKSNKYLDLGELLTKFKSLCQGLSPEHKGYAIGNQPKLAEAHNSYAKPESNSQPSISRHGRLSTDYSFASSSATASSSLGSNLSSAQTLLSSSPNLASSSANGSSSSSGNEIFHFICFVPINGRLYELDGLKPYPVDHGSLFIDAPYDNSSASNWTIKFKQIIRQRLNSFNNGQQNHEIRFNLMALVPDKMAIFQEQIDLLKHNRKILNNSINDFVSKDLMNYSTKLDKDIFNSINKYEQDIKKEAELTNTSLNSVDIKLTRLKQIDLLSPSNASLNEDLNGLKSNTTTMTTRQLRSTRSTNNLKEDLAKYDQFLFEICFQLKHSDEQDEKLNKSKLIDTIDLYDLFKQYRIESIKYLSVNIKKENEFDNELKQQSDNNSTNVIINQLKLDLDKDSSSTTLLTSSSTATSLSNQLIKRKLNLTILKQIESKLELDIESEESKCNEEIEKRKKYRIDALRRKHIYDEFIVTYLNVLYESGKLTEIIQNNGHLMSNGNGSNSSNVTHSNGSSSKHTNSSSNSVYSHSASKKLKKK